ncbi:hypothetical protein AKO1_007105 [Acrasis kona]|uniref:Uncharacterized protein n=1 Tax=Acrasis kona TaxID=1008807 RepID=A0AAW2YVN7_9EUKA
MIKKRVARATQRTKTTTQDEEEEDILTLNNLQNSNPVVLEALKHDVTTNIELAKLKQKGRSRAHGVKIIGSRTGSLVAEQERLVRKRKREAETTNILYGGTKGGLVAREDNYQGKDPSDLFNETQFTSQSKSEVDVKMEEFVENELKKKGFSKNQPENDSRFESELNNSDIFKIPAHLKVNVSLFKEDVDGDLKKKKSSSKSKNGDDLTIEDERSQILSGGILEVPLPIEYKIRNIEETEKLKQRLAREAREKQHQDESLLSQNFNSNYNMHHKRYIQEQLQSYEGLKEELERQEEEEEDYQDDDDGSEEENFEKQTSMSSLRRKEVSSDEKLLEKFKKRYKRVY